MANTIIKQCNCKSEFQDATYGKGNRVHNVKQNGKCVCTVCGKQA
jgi:hypothetical protein